MRPLLTWLVVGALVVIGLFAARDALRADPAPAGAPSGLETRPAPVRTSGPPAIPGRAELVRDLEALAASGTLAVLNVDCRRFLLHLPDLRWTATETLSGTECSRGPRTAIDERFGLAAVDVGGDTVEVYAQGWVYGFRGTAPAFKPGGTLTFVRDGRLWEWSAVCSAGSPIVDFQGLRAVSRCAVPVEGAPRNTREAVWLTERDYVAVAGPDRATQLLAVRGGKAARLFQSVGLRMGGLEASPGGRFVSARLNGSLALFRTDAVGTQPVPPGAEAGRSIAWSPDDRYAALATESFVYVYPSSRPREAVMLPVSAAAIAWR